MRNQFTCITMENKWMWVSSIYECRVLNLQPNDVRPLVITAKMPYAQRTSEQIFIKNRTQLVKRHLILQHKWAKYITRHHINLTARSFTWLIAFDNEVVSALFPLGFGSRFRRHLGKVQGKLTLRFNCYARNLYYSITQRFFCRLTHTYTPGLHTFYARPNFRPSWFS